MITEVSGWRDDATGMFWHVWLIAPWKGTTLQLSDVMLTGFWNKRISVFDCALRPFIGRIQPNIFHTFSRCSLRYSGSHSQHHWWLKHQLKMVWCEMKGGRDLGDLELQSMTSVFTNAAVWLGGLRCVIGLAVSEEQVGWAGLVLVGARGGALWGWGGVGGGDVQNDGNDD